MELNMERLLEIENDRQLLKFRFAYKDTLVWPFIRFCTLQSLQLNELQKPGGNGGSTSFAGNCFWTKIGNGIVKNPFFSGRKPIMFLYGCGGNVTDEQGKIYNRIFDGFAGLYADKTYILDRTERDIAKKAVLKKHYTYLTDCAVDYMVETVNTDPKDMEMAGQLLKYLKKIMSPYTLTHSQAETIRQLILLYSKKIKYQDIFYRNLFRLVRPKVVFIEDGCYGERNAYLCKLLSEMKIASAEIQHGWIGARHIAYNYGQLIRQNREYQTYMPDYYCGMAEYWLKQIRVPVKKVCLGNPTFWTNYEKYYTKSKQAENARSEKTILWLGFEDDRLNMDVLRDFLMRSQGKYQILLRNHPLLRERSDLLYKNLIRNAPNLRVDSSQTVYEAFTRCDYVVSEASTAIYEALAFGKQVFVYQSELSRHYGMAELGTGFEDAGRLAELLLDTRALEPEQEACYRELFFSSKWKKNYSHFLNICTGSNYNKKPIRREFS